MADKNKEDFGTKVVNGLAAMAAAFVARKVLILAWTKVTGKEPPTNPEDPQVGLREALGWSMMAGVAVESGCSRSGLRRAKASQCGP